MKEIIYNKNNLDSNDIQEIVIRVKAAIINNKNEILFGYCNNIYQFPGGHLEEGETLSKALIREVREETGIELEVLNYEAFLHTMYRTYNYRNSGKNRQNDIYYFLIKTDDEPNINNIELDEYEKKGNYEIKIVNLNDFEKVLKDHLIKNPDNQIIASEMLDALKELNKIL